MHILAPIRTHAVCQRPSSPRHVNDILPSVEFEITRLYLAFTRDLVTDAICTVVTSDEFAELATELAADLSIVPTAAGSLLHRIVHESRTRVRGIAI